MHLKMTKYGYKVALLGITSEAITVTVNLRRISVRRSPEAAIFRLHNRPQTMQPKLPASMGTWPKLADRSVWAHGNTRKGGKKARTQNIKRKPRKGIPGSNRRCSGRSARLPRTSPRFGAGQRWPFSLFFPSLPRIAMCPY